MTSFQTSPISWPPSQYWDGFDGNWSTFPLQIGSPPQVVRVLPSTAGQTTSVISSHGCLADFKFDCVLSRGGVFDSLDSETWSNRGNYALGSELNLGYSDNGTYGLDTVALGFSNTTGDPWLESHLISEIETLDFPLGSFGLGIQQTNLSTYDDGYPSFLMRLKKRNLIPSLSWSYTAGAQYRLKGVFGSLTFGGYDLSRFEPNDVSFSLATDISRDLVVGLQAIKKIEVGQNETIATQLLPLPILTFVDSTFPWIYLPREACQKFEKQFGLVYNSTLQNYVVTDTQHDILTSSNLSITFTIGDSQVGGPTVDIVLPYSSFDLELKPPYAPSNTRYFPIQPAQNESQYTLGRTFFQEAYISVNYETSNFSISQCRFDDGVPANVLPFLPANVENKPARSHKAIIGGAVGTAAFLLLSLIFFFSARLIRQRRKINIKTTPPVSSVSVSPNFPSMSKTPIEIGENSYREMDGTGATNLTPLSQSMLLSRSIAANSEHSKLPGSRASSASKRPLPVFTNSQRVTRQSPKWNHRRQTFEAAIPPASSLGRPLPLTPMENNMARTRRYTEEDSQSKTHGGKLIHDYVHEWATNVHELVRDGTPF